MTVLDLVNAAFTALGVLATVIAAAAAAALVLHERRMQRERAQHRHASRLYAVPRERDELAERREGRDGGRCA